MQMPVSVAIILDELEYKKKESLLRKVIEKSIPHSTISFHYTTYENPVIRQLFKLKHVGNFLYHLAYWLQSFLYAVKIRVLFKGNLTVVCFNPIVGYFLSLLAPWSAWRIILLGFLFEPKSNKTYYGLRKAFVRVIAARVAAFVVYSEAEICLYETLFPKSAGKFRYVLYGRDFDLWNNRSFSSPYEIYVSSGGGSNRDYATLCRAYEATNTQIPLCIATQPENIKFKYNTSKINIRYDIRLDRFGDFLQKSKLVILPLMDYGISAGHMVLLHAMQLGKIIIVASVPSVREYVTDKEVIFYEPGNVHDLSDKIADVMIKIEEYRQRGENARRIYTESFTFNALLNRTLQIV